MTKIAIAVLLVVATMINNAPVGNAQQGVVSITDAKRTVKKLPPKGRDSDIDSFRCGDYFLYDAESLGFNPPGPRLIVDTLPLPGEKGGMRFFNLKRLFRTYIDGTAKEPQLRLVMRNTATAGSKGIYGNLPSVTLSANDISEIGIYIRRDDYERSAECLPRPE